MTSKTMKCDKCELKDFEKYLYSRNLAKRSVEAYVQRVELFLREFGKLTDETISEWKEKRIDELKATSYINSSLISLGHYAKFLKLDVLIPKSVPSQKQQFLDDVITRADYDYLLNFLKGNFNKNGFAYERMYIAIKIIGTTGLRISELLNVKVEDIKQGVFDIYGKRSKSRRIYIPETTQEELLSLLHKIGVVTGFTIVDRNYKQMKLRTLQLMFERLAEQTGIRKEVMHAHSFRHFFAKEFIRHHNDICVLADLLGHSNLNTTRIYLKLTSREQKELVDKVVDW